ncbi:MAG: hypothetical protein L3J63_05640 [Geopsychrobacter sp.]|nr:hypothetical protein [Geopsychrobacter sp.]
MRKRIKLIANPVSGGDARPNIERARTVLEASGAWVDLFVTGKTGDARAAADCATAQDYDLVIAAGGDGTLNEVANGLIGRNLPLAFLPLGTANVMALEMGIPTNIEAACAIALGGTRRKVHLAEIDGRLFLMMVGVGFDAAAVEAVSSSLKKNTGKFAYVVAGLQAFLFYRPKPLQIQTCEGEKIQAWHAIITNIRLYGGHFVMAEQGSLQTPGLIVCMADGEGRWALLLFWLRILLRGHLLGAVRRIETNELILEGQGVPLQVDGDKYCGLPVRIRSLPDCLELVFPLS